MSNPTSSHPIHRPPRLVALLAVLVVAPFTQAATLRGEEFRVNTDTTNAQSPIGVAMSDNGNDIVIGWVSSSPSGTGLYAQRYANDGTALGNAFRLDTGDSAANTQNTQAELVGMYPNGFAVAWTGQRPGLSGRQSGIWLRLFAADGTARGDAIAVNTQNGGSFGFANVRLSRASNNDIAVAYTANSPASDSTALQPTVRVQRFDGNGTKQGTELTLATGSNPDLLGIGHTFGNGPTVLVSDSRGPTYLHRYESFPSGGAAFAPVELQEAIGGGHPMWISDVEFVMAEYRVETHDDGSTTPPHYTLVRYHRDGYRTTDRVEVSDCGPLYGDGKLRLAQGADGSILAAFHCPRDAGGTASSSSFQQMRAVQGVFVREFARNLVARGPEVQVNTYTQDVQDLPAIGMDGLGRAVLAWRSEGQDGSDTGVYARRVTVDGVANTNDGTPDGFSFDQLSDAPRGVESRSNTITISGINIPVPIHVEGGEYSIGCNGSFTAADATVTNGNTVCVRHTTATTGRTTTTTTLSVGSFSAAYRTITAADVQGPAADLSIRVTDDPDPVVTGGVLTYTVRLRNESPQTASAPNIPIDLLLSQTVRDFSASGLGMRCSGDLTRISCVKIDGYFGGEEGSIDVRVTAPAQAGSLTLTATVFQQNDPVEANNSSSQTTTVRAAGGGGSSGTVNDPSGRPVAVQLSGGTLEDLRAVATPGNAPSASYGLGFFAFDVGGVAPGGSVTVTVTVPSGTSADGLVKCVGGVCADFLATISGRQLSFVITDNGAGDSNPTLGRISDPFGVVTLGAVGGSRIDVSSGGGALGFWALLPLWTLLAGRRHRGRRG